MKKIYIAWVCILVTALLLPACGKNVDPDCIQEEVFCVGLVTTNGGKIEDHSVNQAAWEALQEAQTELGATVNYIETNDWKDYDKNISWFGDANYDVIIAVGLDLTDATFSAAKQYPQSFFIGIDQSESEASPSNLTVLTFPTNQAGFLAGAFAALMTKTQRIGGVFASGAIPYIWRLGEGYKAGAKYINPEVGVIVLYHNDDSNVDSKETLSDPEWGAGGAKVLIDNGVDIIFAAGEKTGNGALVGAVEGGALAIGFDADQFITLPEAKKGMLTSIIKRITPEIFSIIEIRKKGEINPSRTIIGGQMEYAPFHLRNSDVSDETRAKIKEVQAGLIDGSIKINIPLRDPGIPAPPEPTAIPIQTP